MYYNIEVINNLNIEFIAIFVNRTQNLTRKNTGTLVLNSNPGSHFFPGCSEQAQNWFWNSLKIKSPQQAIPANLSCNTIVFQWVTLPLRIIQIRKYPKSGINKSSFGVFRSSSCLRYPSGKCYMIFSIHYFAHLWWVTVLQHWYSYTGLIFM